MEKHPVNSTISLVHGSYSSLFCFPKIKQAQDEERRQLIQLRDILKSALQVEQKEVRGLNFESVLCPRSFGTEGVRAGSSRCSGHCGAASGTTAAPALFSRLVSYNRLFECAYFLGEALTLAWPSRSLQPFPAGPLLRE